MEVSVKTIAKVLLVTVILFTFVLSVTAQEAKTTHYYQISLSGYYPASSNITKNHDGGLALNLGAGYYLHPKWAVEASLGAGFLHTSPKGRLDTIIVAGDTTLKWLDWGGNHLFLPFNVDLVYLLHKSDKHQWRLFAGLGYYLIPELPGSDGSLKSPGVNGGIRWTFRSNEKREWFAELAGHYWSDDTAFDPYWKGSTSFAELTVGVSFPRKSKIKTPPPPPPPPPAPKPKPKPKPKPVPEPPPPPPPPADMDNDGIPDDRDKDNYTPYPAPVDKYGVTTLKVLEGVLIEFSLNSAVIEEAEKVKIKQLAKAMWANPKIHIEISGHADASGGDKMNHRLSIARAENVYRHLVQYGADPNRMKNLGQGEKKLLNAGDPYSSENRRVEIRIVQ